MEPHHELAGLGIVDDFRTLQDASVGDFRVGIGTHLQGDSLVFPVIEVPRRITVHTDVRLVSGTAFRLMLSEPVVYPLMEKDASPMRIDGNTLVIGPDLAGAKRIPLGSCRKQRQEHRDKDKNSLHTILFYKFTDKRSELLNSGSKNE